MNGEQRKYYNMFVNTQDLFDNMSTAWSPVKKVGAYKNELDEIIVRISDKSSDVAASTTAVTEKKNALKESIAIKASSLSGVLQALAAEHDDQDLLKKVDVSKSDVMKTPEGNVKAGIGVLISVANEHITELADYGVNEEMLTELQTSVDDFDTLLGKPRSILNSKYVTMDSIDELFDAGNNLLRNKVDKIMMMYRESNPDLYNGYKRARTIVD